MSRFLFGIINHKISSPFKDGNSTDEFIDFLYEIEKIGIEQRLSVLIGAVQRNDPDGLYKLIPPNLNIVEMSFSFLVNRSPMDNTSDNLFIDWEYEASRDDYVPGKEKVFKEIENFFNQVFALNEVKSIWLRYQCMFSCDVNKFDTIEDLEAKIYKQCSNSFLFSIHDFEIYREKEKGTLLPEVTSGTEETDF